MLQTDSEGIFYDAIVFSKVKSKHDEKVVYAAERYFCEKDEKSQDRGRSPLGQSVPVLYASDRLIGSNKKVTGMAGFTGSKVEAQQDSDNTLQSEKRQ